MGVEAETRLTDVQAVDRRIGVKCRDSGIPVAILVLADTWTNRLAVRSAGSVLRAFFPLAGIEAARTLRAGALPTVNALIFCRSSGSVCNVGRPFVHPRSASDWVILRSRRFGARHARSGRLLTEIRRLVHVTNEFDGPIPIACRLRASRAHRLAGRISGTDWRRRGPGWPNRREDRRRRGPVQNQGRGPGRSHASGSALRPHLEPQVGIRPGTRPGDEPRHRVPAPAAAQSPGPEGDPRNRGRGACPTPSSP